MNLIGHRLIVHHAKRGLPQLNRYREINRLIYSLTAKNKPRRGGVDDMNNKVSQVVAPETYGHGTSVMKRTAALVELSNAQKTRPLAALWGGGSTSYSDGQYFRVGSHGRYAAQVNLKYGLE